MPTIGKPARVEGAVTGGASRGGDGRVVTTGGRVRFRLTDFLGRVITTIPQRSTRDTIGHQVGQCNPRNMMGALNVFDGHVPIGLLLDLSVLLEFLAKGLMYRWGCVEAPSGVEPLHRSFADCSLNHLGTAPRAHYSGPCSYISMCTLNGTVKKTGGRCV